MIRAKQPIGREADQADFALATVPRLVTTTFGRPPNVLLRTTVRDAATPRTTNPNVPNANDRKTGSDPAVAAQHRVAPPYVWEI